MYRLVVQKVSLNLFVKPLYKTGFVAIHILTQCVNLSFSLVFNGTLWHKQLKKNES